jgi:hypothetical protein
MSRIVPAAAAACAAASLLAIAWSASAQEPPAEARAVAFLSQEIGRASGQACRSCHHHGVAARALFAARDRGLGDGPAPDGTVAFLSQPSAWSQNAGHRDSDKGLARLAFAGALAAAGSKDLKPSQALVEASALVEADQKPDGSWTPHEATQPGSPTTLGTAVATWMARTTLIAAGREPDHFAVAQIDRWMRTAEPQDLVDATGVLLALGTELDVMAVKSRSLALDILRSAQSAGGGWGPTAGAPPEVFDTALAMLALAELARDARVARTAFGESNLALALSRGRAFLQAAQQPDGSWPPTMRGGERPNDAARVATTAWALLALLESAR